MSTMTMKTMILMKRTIRMINENNDDNNELFK